MKKELTRFLDQFPEVVANLGVVTGGLLVGLVFKFVIFAALRRYGRRRKDAVLAKSVDYRLGQASTWFLPILAVSLLLPLVQLAPKQFEVLRRIVEIALTITFAWGLINVTDVLRTSSFTATRWSGAITCAYASCSPSCNS